MRDWHESEQRTMGSGLMATRLEQSLGILTQYGVRVPPSGRHREALRLLRKVNEEAIPLSHADSRLLGRVQAAHRDAYELFLITFAAVSRSQRRETPFTLARLQTMMAGPELGDGTNTRPRNIQFELFVAAMLVLGGAEVHDAEPDLLLLYGREMIGVAVKRLVSLSEDQGKRNFKKAVAQIKSSERRGIVAVNLDSTFSGVPLTVPKEELLVEFQARFDKFDRVFKPFWNPNPRVLGYIAFAYLSEWMVDTKNSNKPGLEIATAFRWFGWPNDDAEGKLSREFSKVWQDRLEAKLAELSSRDALWT